MGGAFTAASTAAGVPHVVPTGVTRTSVPSGGGLTLSARTILLPRTTPRNVAVDVIVRSPETFTHSDSSMFESRQNPSLTPHPCPLTSDSTGGLTPPCSSTARYGAPAPQGIRASAAATT